MDAEATARSKGAAEGIRRSDLGARNMDAETRPAKVGKWTEAALRVLRERYLAREGGE